MAIKKDKKATYSMFRKVNRNMIKQQTKAENKKYGVPKKKRLKVSDVWNYFQDKRYGEGKHTAILINNAPKGKKRRIYEERVGK